MKRFLTGLLRPLAALCLALLLGAVVIAVSQKSVTAPLAAYHALFLGAFGDANAWAATLSRTMPLLLTGAAVGVALAAGLFNIGAEGQMAVGALAGATVGFLLHSLPPVLLLPLCFAASAVGGAGWAFLPAYLKVKRGTHEVITAILLNYVAQNTTRYLATFPLKDPNAQGGQTPEIGAALPRLFATYDVHWGLPLALFLVFVFAWALRRTVWGYETRAVGLGSGASEAAGIDVSRTRINAMLLSGALAGVAGAVVVLGVVPFRRFPADFYGIGYGFDGLAVALLASGSLWAVVPAALLFGALGSGAEAMAFATPTPKQIVLVVEAILIVFVAARRFPMTGLLRRRPKGQPV